jgi:CHAT domain-containing protein
MRWWAWPVAVVLGLLTARGAAAASCINSPELAAGRLADRHVELKGNGEVRIDLHYARVADAIVYAVENGVDVELEAHDASGGLIGRADNAVARIGTQRVFLPASVKPIAYVVVRGREHPGVSGSVHVQMVRASAPDDPSHCRAATRALAAADQAYAQARVISLGSADDSKSTPAAGNARALLESAASQYQKTAASLDSQTTGDELGDVQLTLAALYYYDLQDWTRSAQWADAAATTFRKANRPYLRARAQAILAAAWLEIPTKSSATGSAMPAESAALLNRARTLLAQLETFHRARGEAYDRALQINNIGLAYFYEGRLEPALTRFNQARAEFERIGETQRVVMTLQNIALCEWGLGRPSAALPVFDRALSLMAPKPYPDIYLAVLFNSALAHYAAGRFDDSLRLNGQAVDLANQFQMDRARGRGYYGLGATFYDFGVRELATRFLRSALELVQPDVDVRVRVSTLRALAVIESEMGETAKAAAHDSEALRLATSPSGRSRILIRLASDYAAQGDAAAALNVLDPLIAFPPNDDTQVQALALVQRAKLRREAGSLDSARRDVLQALETLSQFEAVTDEFEARVELARIEQDAGNDDAALVALTEALNHTAEITSQTANPEYRASIAQSVRPALDLKIDLLWKRYQRETTAGDAAAARGTIIESLRAADSSRATAFEQVRAQRLNNSSDPRIAELQRTIAVLYRDLAERRFQLATREDRYGPNEASARGLREDISRLRARLGVVNAELAARATPASSARGSPVSKDWLTRALGERADKALIEYWIGTATAYAWTVANGTVSWVRLEPSAQIDTAARSFHEALRSYATTPVRARLDGGAELYRLVLAPIRARLATARELTIVPDGALHYVPFSAMRDPMAEKPFIAQNYAIDFAPALRFASSRHTAPPRSWAGSRMLLVADPIYSPDDPRLPHAAAATRATPVSRDDRLSNVLRTRGGLDPATLERLVSSTRESEQIRSLPGLRRVDVLEGFDATRAGVLAQDLSQYRFIHIASHGFIDSEIPQLSALILGAWDRSGRVSDQYVRAGDLLSRTFEAEVVVLSACDTALGRQIAGEGLVGLEYAALARGARSVVASLWPVSDAIAADLMTDMYRYITADGYPVATALAASIRAALTRTPSLDPALWGPFAVYVAAD